jgi:hypothetical protein
VGLLTKPRNDSWVASTRRWGWAQYLALFAVPVLFWEIWTVVAWLADNPHEITQYQTPGSTDWWAATSLEAIAIVAAVPVLIYVIRGCIRARGMTLDSMFCLAGLTICWCDLGCNFFQPTFLTSSNFVNLNYMCGNMPLVVNPDCGRVSDPLLLTVPLFMFDLLGLAILLEHPIRWARNRWPGISTVRLLGILFLIGLVFDMALEPTVISLGLWTYFAPSGFSLHLGQGLRYAFPEFFCGPIFFAFIPGIRVFRNDRGQTIAERGTENLSPRLRKPVTFLALYAVIQFITWVPSTLPLMLLGPYDTVPKTPAYLLQDVCDAPGVTNSPYGLCPGAPGYEMPGRTSRLSRSS